MAFSVPIGGTIFTAIALIIFNRKWILKKLRQCCINCCDCSTHENTDVILDDLEKIPDRWTIHRHHIHDETKV